MCSNKMHLVAIFTVLCSLLIPLTSAGRQPRHIIFGKCYNFQTSPTLDISKWSKGKWFEIQRYANSFEDGTNCNTQVYYLDSTKRELDISFSMINNNNETKLLQGKANYTISDTEIESGVTFPDDREISTFDVISTDYDKYAVVYSCYQVFDDQWLPEKQERLWLLSRNPSLDDEIKTVVKNILQVNGTDLTRYFDEVSQENCP